jgi:hypothetical protein
VRSRTLFLALVAVLSLLSANAVAGGHRVVQGTNAADELTMGEAGNRVFARAGDDMVDGGAGNDRLRGGRGDDALFGGDDNDRLRGGQDNDLLDGGEGDDYLNGGGDGRDKDRIVCGDGYDVVVLGRKDVVLVEVEASEHPAEEDAPAGDESDDPVLEEPESGDDDGCEKVKHPGDGPRTCASTNGGCHEGEAPCASNYGGCEDPVDEPCAATYRDCDDPVVGEPEPDPPVEVEQPDEL